MDMDSALKHYGFFVLVILIGTAGLGAVFWRSKRASRTRDGRRSLLDYLLLWPLLFGNDNTRSGDVHKSASFPKRVVIGWLIVLALVVSAMILDW
jgi:hypothetical protein